ncbi:MAG: hypothetical protein K2X34_08915 [Hyphomonadaceae bacterium]|nr:hypothetical protein [Hyphomonadaceae bacterium]
MLASLLANVLTAIRDFVIAAALAWVGISMDRVESRVESERPCAADTCQPQAD